MSFCFSTIDRVVGLGLRTSRVESQRRFAVGPEVRPYPGAEGQHLKAMGPWYKPKNTSYIRCNLRETSVNAALELMSQDQSVIAFNCHGIPEMLDDSCGYLVDSADEGDEAGAFARKVTDIIRHPDVGAAKGRAASDKARSVLSWESKWQTLLPLYRKLCAEEAKC